MNWSSKRRTVDTGGGCHKEHRQHIRRPTVSKEESDIPKDKIYGTGQHGEKGRKVSWD